MDPRTDLVLVPHHTSTLASCEVVAVVFIKPREITDKDWSDRQFRVKDTIQPVVMVRSPKGEGGLIEPQLIRVEGMVVNATDGNFHDVIANVPAWIGIPPADMPYYFLEIFCVGNESVPFGDDLEIKLTGSTHTTYFDVKDQGYSSTAMRWLPIYPSPSQGTITSLTIKNAAGGAGDAVMVTVAAYRWPDGIVQAWV